MLTIQKFVYLLVVMSLFLLGGCETLNSGVGGVLKLDTNVTLSLDVEADINPDERNTPSPLYVRLYQLKDTKLFLGSDFVQLYERDEEVIGAEFISKQVLKLVQPGQDRKEKFVLEKDTQYIGLYAEFFQYKNSKFKLVVPVTSNNVIRDAVKIRISGNRMTLLEK